MVEKRCNSCDGELEVKRQILSNGDEVCFLRCNMEGLYAVYNPYNETVVTSDDHEADHDIDSTYSAKMDNGDRVELQYCSKCGFYALDQGLPV